MYVKLPLKIGIGIEPIDQLLINAITKVFILLQSFI